MAESCVLRCLKAKGRTPVKIRTLGAPRVIMSNSGSIHHYFAWPTVARLKNGRLAVGASGFRIAHICPFGKGVIALSENEGETYTPPMTVIDTVLDDRDVGLCPFGESGLIVTSFNNTVDFQRKHAQIQRADYRNAYLDQVTPEAEKAALGVTFRVSHDNGVTFGPIFHSPVTSPHGPLELKDGSILWVGRSFSKDDSDQGDNEFVAVYKLNPETGECASIGRIDSITDEHGRVLSCEPHTIELPDGTLLCHIRAERSGADDRAWRFTLYQTRSKDGGKTWEKPYPLMGRLGGAPAHLLRLPSGSLISVYGCREKPKAVCAACGEQTTNAIRLMYSRDNGETWSTGHTLVDGFTSSDLGYPSTIELSDHSLLTVYYARPEQGAPAVIYQQKWILEE